MQQVDFYYDVVCPYAYLAHTQIEALCARCNAELTWHPILLGGLFRSIGAGDGPMPTMNAAKLEINRRDMFRWAEYFDVPLKMPPTHPNRTVTAMRTIIASADPVAAAKTLFDAYWRDGRDLSDEATLRSALADAGMDGAGLIDAASDPAIKQALRDNTDAAAKLGAFGVPTFIVGDELFWGQDRMHFVEKALQS